MLHTPKKNKWSFPLLRGSLRIRWRVAHTLHWLVLVKKPNSTALWVWSLKSLLEELRKFTPAKNPAQQEIQVLAERESAGTTKETIASLTPSGEEKLEWGVENMEGGSEKRENGTRCLGHVTGTENLFHLCLSAGRNKEMLTRHASLNPSSSWPVWLCVMVGQPVCLPAHTTVALQTHSIDLANKFRLAATLSRFQAVASEV